MRFILFLCLWTLGLTQEERAIVQVSGNMMYTYTNGDDHSLNDNTNADNPFNTLRTKLFFFSALAENIETDVEIMYDSDAKAGRLFWLHGAQIKFFEVGNLPSLNIKVGRIPLNIGRFSSRVDETINGLIGVPVVYSYQTLVDWEQVWDPSSQKVLRKNRDAQGKINKSWFPTASPIAYESCWNTGIEFFGFVGDFEYSVQFSNESITNPKKFDKNDLQLTGRLGYQFSEWLNLGISGARNRYLSTSINLVANQSIKDYYHTLYGMDGTIEFQVFKLFGEMYYSRWDSNLLNDERLEAYTGFFELNYLLPFTNDLEFVNRVDMMQFNKISLHNGSRFWWDSNFIRIEAGFKYEVRKNVYIKGVYQHWEFDHYEPTGTFATQLIVSF